MLLDQQHEDMRMQGLRLSLLAVQRQALLEAGAKLLRHSTHIAHEEHVD